MIRIRSRRVTACCLILAGLLGAPAWAQTTRATGKCFMWKAQSPTCTVWLLGSVHVGRESFYPLPVEVQRAFESAQSLAVEVDIEKADQAALLGLMMKHGLLGGGAKLSDLLPEETWTAIKAWCKDRGVPLLNLIKAKPWLAALTINMQEMQALGFDANLGIDRHFLLKAREANKTVVELETAEEQLTLLAGIPDDLAREMLVKGMAELKDLKPQMQGMIQSWEDGDAARLEEIAITDSLKKFPQAKPLIEKLFDERNVKMVEKIEGMLKGKDTCFVVVGAGHMVGPKGIVKLLEAKGHKLEQAKASPRPATAPAARTDRPE